MTQVHLKSWMAAKLLQLSEKKVLLFGQQYLTFKVSPHLGTLSPFVKAYTKNLGAIFELALKFDKQINQVVKTNFIQL